MDSDGKVRVFVGGVGNPWRRDLDFGPMFIRRIAGLDWPPDVAIEDASVSAHRVLHILQDRQPERVVFVAGFPRGDPAGTVRRHPVEGPMPDDEMLMALLGEAAGGVIDFDATLAVVRHFGALPADSVVIEVEATDTTFGTGFSDEVEASIDRVLEMVREEIAR